MPFKKEENQEAFNNIIDTFSGGDPAKFISFKFGMEQFEGEGTLACEKIMDVMIKFSKLIDIMHRRRN